MIRWQILAQASEAVTLGSKAIDASSQYGGAIWLLSVLLIALLILAAIWLWKVSIPNQASQRENSAKLTEALTTMSSVVSSTHSQVTTTGQDVVDVKATLRAVCKAKVVEFSILEKLSNNSGLNLSVELGQLKGLSEASSEMIGK